MQKYEVIWQNWCLGQFCHLRIEVLQMAQFLAKAETLVIIVSA